MTISKIFVGFKFFTAAIGRLLGIIFIIGGIVFLGHPVSLILFVSGTILYVMGRHLEGVMDEEERKRKYFEDQGD